MGCVSTPPADAPTPPPTPLTTRPTEAERQQRAALTAAIGEGALSPEDFAARYPTTFATSLPYDPRQATGLSTIQASPLQLNADELDALGRKGFAITERRRFPTFTYGYASIYMADLPLYVSADSVLHAVHSSYDDILAAIETASLAPELDAMLASMRARLDGGAAASLGAQPRADADLYVTVAYGLLRGSFVAPTRAGGSAAEARALFDAAQAGAGTRAVRLFGTEREEDFSQYRPRAHYTDTPELQRYFRAMMWLGRTDLRILETQSDGTQLLRRRQLLGAYALRDAMDDAALARWRRIDRAIGAFVGESDNMTLDQLAPLLRDLRVDNAAALAGLSDQTIADAIRAGSYGAQRIASHLMTNGLGRGTLPLSSSFLLMGQRYVLDSHVFSNVVYDRVAGGSVRRMMPDPLDAAFAALGNDQAGALLGDSLRRYGYARDLHAMRVLADAHGDAYWNANLYNRWMASLRTLSPRAAMDPAAAQGLPTVARTEAWGRRILNTQLASWAELRHDTLLYAKQSYTTGAVCEFPDAYVEPYPAFWSALGEYARRGEEVVATLDLAAPLGDRVRAYFPRLREVAGRLRDMAESQRAGRAFTAEQMAFINEAVSVQTICGSATSMGWFPRLYFNNASATDFDPTIADVHTQPTDESGNPVGRVLHVGTGSPRLMVVTVETCNGPRAYAGLASTYLERVTERYDRLTDERWAEAIRAQNPADPPWLAPVVTR